MGLTFFWTQCIISIPKPHRDFFDFSANFQFSLIMCISFIHSYARDYIGRRPYDLYILYNLCPMRAMLITYCQILNAAFTYSSSQQVVVKFYSHSLEGNMSISKGWITTRYDIFHFRLMKHTSSFNNKHSNLYSIGLFAL